MSAVFADQRCVASIGGANYAGSRSAALPVSQCARQRFYRRQGLRITAPAACLVFRAACAAAAPNRGNAVDFTFVKSCRRPSPLSAGRPVEILDASPTSCRLVAQREASGVRGYRFLNTVIASSVRVRPWRQLSTPGAEDTPVPVDGNVPLSTPVK